MLKQQPFKHYIKKFLNMLNKKKKKLCMGKSAYHGTGPPKPK
jgi:hypothetical protein